MNTHETNSIKASANRHPRPGDRKIAATVLPTPDQTTAWIPALVRPAPTRPPIRACELDDGSPSRCVTICQTIAPECFLVREKQMDWFGVCLVTDRDTRDPGALVNTGLIYENMNRHKDRYAATLLRIFEGLKPSDRLGRTVQHAVPRSELAEYRDD